jgi:hypothetical protein
MEATVTVIERSFTTGEVSDLTGVHRETLKVWKRRGIVSPDGEGWSRYNFAEVLEVAILGALAEAGFDRKDFLAQLRPQLQNLHGFDREPAFLVIGPKGSAISSLPGAPVVYDPKVVNVEIVRWSALAAELGSGLRQVAAVVALDVIAGRLKAEIEKL